MCYKESIVLFVLKYAEPWTLEHMVDIFYGNVNHCERITSKEENYDKQS